MKVKLYNGVQAPTRKRSADAGYDMYLNEDVTFKAHETTVVNTDVAVEIPDGYAGLLCTRSSAAMKSLIMEPILIDSNYRGVCHAIVYNNSDKDISYKKGERVYSLFVFPVFQEPIEVVNRLSETDRGSSWNGSSGGVTK